MGALVRALRPHQWTKNLLVFAPLALTRNLLQSEALLRAALAFGVFCALSGAVYLINDLTDVERDRLHPRKRMRPLASGALSVGTARLAAILIAAASLAAAATLGGEFLAAAFAYLALNVGYSFWWKRVVIVDVLALSLGFVLRALAGALAISVEFSHWLLVCTLLLALFLALAKRRHELVLLGGSAHEHREILAEYNPYLLDQMIAVVTASCLMAYSFYTLAPETIEKYRTDRLSWTIPFVLYGIFRYLYLVHAQEEGGSPTDVLLTDRPLLIDVALWAAALVAIVYTAQGAPPRG